MSSPTMKLQIAVIATFLMAVSAIDNLNQTSTNTTIITISTTSTTVMPATTTAAESLIFNPDIAPRDLSTRLISSNKPLGQQSAPTTSIIGIDVNDPLKISSSNLHDTRYGSSYSTDYQSPRAYIPIRYRSSESDHFNRHRLPFLHGPERRNSPNLRERPLLSRLRLFKGGNMNRRQQCDCPSDVYYKMTKPKLKKTGKGYILGLLIGGLTGTKIGSFLGWYLARNMKETLQSQHIKTPLDPGPVEVIPPQIKHIKRWIAVPPY
ncbi:hypothetical protein CHUAL_006971 [Chamberlinius hualienensis]